MKCYIVYIIRNKWFSLIRRKSSSKFTKASLITDPVERMKIIAKFFIASDHINKTYGCRVPLNPILGETLQRESPTGERLYAE